MIYNIKHNWEDRDVRCKVRLKKSHLWRNVKRFSLSMWSIFKYDCSVFLFRLSSVWLSVLLFYLLWFYWYSSLHISIQTCVWWKVFLWKDLTMNFRLNIFSLKTRMTFDHCRLLKPDLLRALIFYQIILKHSSEAGFIQKLRIKCFPVPA